MPNIDYYERKYLEGEEVLHSYKLKTLELLRDTPRGKVLDVGCGSGVMASRLRDLGHEVHGLDVSRNAIEKLAARGIPGSVCDLESVLPFPDQSFDAVWCTEVIEHLTTPARLLGEIRRILRPGGRLALSTPNSAHIAYRLLHLGGRTCSELQHPEHLRFFSRSSLQKLLVESGFRIETLSGRNLYLILPLPAAASTATARLAAWLERCGLRRETSHVQQRSFLVWEHFTSIGISLWADTFIASARREG